MNVEYQDQVNDQDDLVRLPWSLASATVTAKGDPKIPSMTPATGTATHSGYASDDLNADDH